MNQLSLFKIYKLIVRIIATAVCIVGMAVSASAIGGRVGPYTVGIVSRPAVVPMGPAALVLTVTVAGQPQSGLKITGLTQMPGMPMGEKVQTASPEQGPGVYSLPASFGMEGSYNVNLTINGPGGHAKGAIPISVGENTAEKTASGATSGLLIGTAWGVCLLAAAAALVLIIRRLGVRKAMSAPNVASVLLAVLCLVGGRYAYLHLRRPGAMTPLEGQTMSMDMLPPPGALPITAYTVRRRLFVPKADFPATVASSQDTVIASRVPGILVWMPLYPGDRVHKGQLIARIDSSSQLPIAAQADANAAATRAARTTASAELAEAQANTAAAKAALTSQKESAANATLEAQAAAAATETAKAELVAAQAAVPQAKAAEAAARQSLSYRQSVLKRDRELLSKGYVSRQTVDLDEAKAADAASLASAAEATLAQAEAGLAAKRSAVTQAELQAKAAQAAANAAAGQTKAALAHLSSAEAATGSAKGRLQTAQANVASAEAGITAAQTDLGYTEISSPVDGVVSAREITAGSLATPGQPILTITSAGTLRIQAAVSAADVGLMHVGAPAEVMTSEGNVLHAVLTVIPPNADPSTRLVTVEASIAADHTGLRPGDYVTLRLALRSPRMTLTVPTRCVQGGEQGESPYVWVIGSSASGEASGLAHRQPVSLGESDQEFTEIRIGLKPGDVVAEEGAGSLHEGDRVTITNDSDPKPVQAPTTADDAAGIGASSAEAPAPPVIKTGVDCFTPSTVALRLHLHSATFLLTTAACATTVAFAELHLSSLPRLNLPASVNLPVSVNLPTIEHRVLKFACDTMSLHDEVRVR